jgi:DNA-binding response OmpR family regulator
LACLPSHAKFRKPTPSSAELAAQGRAKADWSVRVSFAVSKRGTPDFPTVCPVLEVQDVRVDPQARRVWRAEREIVLSRKEYDLLHALISRPGDIISRDELMRDVWGTSFWTSSKTIDVHLGWVRRKLGDDSRRPILISTIRGRGLRFEAAAPVEV